MLRYIKLESGGDKRASLCRKTTSRVEGVARQTALFAQSAVLSTQSLFYLTPETAVLMVIAAFDFSNAFCHGNTQYEKSPHSYQSPSFSP